MNWIGWVSVGVIVAWPLCWLLQPWRWAAFKAMVTHPPLEPYVPPWWWLARLLRFGYLAWRVLLTIHVLYLSAIVAIGINTRSSSSDIQEWYDSGWRLFVQVIALLMFGFAFDLAIHVWRITNKPSWCFGRRSMVDLYLPACVLGVVLWVGWSVAAGPTTTTS